MSHPQQETILLRHGHTLYRHVACGIAIIAAQGHVSAAMTAVWPADQFHQAKFRLDEGEAHIVQDAGWIVITAKTDAKLILMADNTVEPSFARIIHKLFLLAPDFAKRLLARI